MGRDRIFLTGATGILGANLLKLLLAETDSEILCLVRAETRESAIKRLLNALSNYGVCKKTNEEFASRVIPVMGDAAKPHFGLDSTEFARLAGETGTVVHVAALTDLFLPYRRIEPVNVGGTRNVIDFALLTDSRYLCHISTHTVMGDRTFDGTLIFRETDLDVGQGFGFLSYQKTKFEAEQLVRASKERGLRWNILRPGQIFGDSKDGSYPMGGDSNVTGLFYDIFKTICETRLAFRANTHFDVVPVDCVSRGILELGLRAETFFETYHLVNPDIKRYTNIVELLIEAGYPIRLVSQSEYRDRLMSKTVNWDFTDYKSATTSAFRWWFKRGIDFEQGGLTDSSYTWGRLAERGVFCPPIDGNLIRTYLKAGLATGFFKPPPEAPRKATSSDFEVTV